MKKLLIVIILGAALGIALTGCWNSREINSVAFINSIGFDKAADGILMTVQVLNPKAIAAQKSVNEPAVIVFTETGKDPFEMLRKLITQSSRRLNATHLHIVIFGEDFAKEDGISEILDFFLREHQVRTDVYFTVAKGTSANNIMHILTTLDSIPGVKLSNSLKNSDEAWAGTKTIKIVDLVNNIVCEGSEAVITGIEVINRDENNSIDSLKKVDADPLKIMGLAAFHKDKMAGWLSEEECKGFNYITGNVKSSAGYVEDKDTGKITYEVTGTKVEQKATIEDGWPVMTVSITVTANIETSSNLIDVSKEESLKKIEKLIADKVTDLSHKALDKTQKDLKSDVFSFGEVVHRTYPKEWPKLKENWNMMFSVMRVNVDVDVKIDGTGTISNSVFIKEEGTK